MIIDSRAFLATLTSECCVKRDICKTWTGLSAGAFNLANSADLDLTPQNAASDQGLHCWLKLQDGKGK